MVNYLELFFSNWERLISSDRTLITRHCKTPGCRWSPSLISLAVAESLSVNVTLAVCDFLGQQPLVLFLVLVPASARWRMADSTVVKSAGERARSVVSFRTLRPHVIPRMTGARCQSKSTKTGEPKRRLMREKPRCKMVQTSNGHNKKAEWKNDERICARFSQPRESYGRCKRHWKHVVCLLGEQCIKISFRVAAAEVVLHRLLFH